MNNICIMGRTTSSIECKTTNSGKSVASFTLAVPRSFSKDKTDFIPVTAWNKQAEILSRYVEKGQMIAVQGELQTRKYEDKEGKTRTAYEVIASQIDFCGSKEKSSAGAESPVQGNFSPFVDDFDDSLDAPF